MNQVNRIEDQAQHTNTKSCSLSYSFVCVSGHCVLMVGAKAWKVKESDLEAFIEHLKCNEGNLDPTFQYDAGLGVRPQDLQEIRREVQDCMSAPQGDLH